MDGGTMQAHASAAEQPLRVLRHVLDAASSPRGAAEALVGHLADLGVPLPSLYLEQAGRLRCQAQRGYWQVLDGIPSASGIIGRTFEAGRTVEVVDALSEADFLAAAPDLRSEICVPLRHRGQVVGALNVESTGPMPPGTRELVELAATAYERRLSQLGGPPPESPAQRMSRLASELGVLDSEQAVLNETFRAAIDVTGMSTAAFIEPTPSGGTRLVAGHGPLVEALDLAAADLGVVDGWVGAGSSLYTLRTEGSALVVHGHLRRFGLASLAIVPLRTRGHYLGVLIVTSGESGQLDVDVVPLLEVLALQAASSLVGVRLLKQFEERARRDPMTGLGHNATFHEDLERRSGSLVGEHGFAVLLLDLDGFKAVNDERGHQAGDRLLSEVSVALQDALRGEDQLYRLGGDEFATFLVVTDIAEAAAIAERLRRAASVVTGTTVSIGVAMTTDPAQRLDLVSRADAAMYVAKRGGGDAVSVHGAPVD
jgi:diguanylate cyclase (GGDEF)-like protein